MSEEMKETDFEVTELDDSDLEGAAGGLSEVADPNNCNCTVNNCES